MTAAGLEAALAAWSLPGLMVERAMARGMNNRSRRVEAARTFTTAYPARRRLTPTRHV